MDLMEVLEVGIGSFTLGRLLGAAALALVCLGAIRVLSKALDRLFQRTKAPVTLLGILRAVVRAVLYFIAVIIVMSYLGIPVSSLIAAMSVVGVALSLGVQNFLTNVVGGLQMLASHPFEVGDFVEAGGCAGTVQEIGLFYTKIMTPDNKLIQMPNSSVVAANITNYSAAPTRRVDLTFRAGYDTPVEQVEAALMGVLTAHEMILQEGDQAPFARVSEYAESAIVYTVRVWCAKEDYWTVYFDVTKAVKTAFEQACIRMTYPHVNVHMVEK